MISGRDIAGKCQSLRQHKFSDLRDPVKVVVSAGGLLPHTCIVTYGKKKQRDFPIRIYICICHGL